MITDLQLPLLPTPPAPTSLPWLVGWLFDNPGWHLAPEIEAACDQRLGERQIRALAAGSDSIISGHRGYRHLERASAEEIRHFLAGLESRCTELTARAIRIRRRAHQLVG